MLNRTGTDPRLEVSRQTSTASVKILHAKWHLVWATVKNIGPGSAGPRGTTDKKSRSVSSGQRQIGHSTEHGVSVNVHLIAYKQLACEPPIWQGA
jgi:hypothetical protein